MPCLAANRAMRTWTPSLSVLLWLVAVLSAIRQTQANGGWEPPLPVRLCSNGGGALKPGNQTLQATEGCYQRVEQGDEDSDEFALVSRWEITPLSRIDDLDHFFKSLRIVVRVPDYRASSLLSKTPSVKFCMHRNASAPIGHCGGKWKAPNSNGVWMAQKSPFVQNVLEISWENAKDPGDIYVAVYKGMDRHRVIWFVIGLILMPLSGILSRIVVLYYGVGMSVGVILVVGIILFQIMKLLPMTRGSSVKIVFAGAMFGMGGLLVSYLNGLAEEVADYLGFGDQFANPLVYVALILIILTGAGMGFWIVRKFVVQPSGELDPATVVYVRWMLRAVAGSLLILSSADAILGSVALVVGVILTLLLHNSSRLGQMLLRRLAKLHIGAEKRAGEEEEEGVVEADIPGTPDRDVSRTRSLSPQQSFQPLQNNPAPIAGMPMSSMSTSPMLEQPFVSSYHHIRGRHRLNPREYDAVTKECTRRALADLAASPGLSQWMSRNLNRLQVAPDFRREERSRVDIASTAWMEQGSPEDE